MNLNPKELGEIDHKRWQRLTMHAPNSTEDWYAIAEFVLEVMGVLKIVQFGDIQMWRRAVAERSDGPLPPLNLPLPIWEAYSSSPFSSLKFHFSDGTEKHVSRWENVFYSWHSRMIAIVFEDDSSVAYPANDIVSVSRTEPSPSHTNTLERLRWYKTSNRLSPICVRMKWGKAFLIEDPDLFNIDHSGNILAFASPGGTQVIHIADIESVRSASDQSVLVEEIVRAQKAVPFRPFQIKFCDDTRWTVLRPEHLIVASTRLVIANGEGTPRGFAGIEQKSIEWLDGIEILPPGKSG